ncbi:RNA polymerase-binding transcription factor DksA [mine drainage metagenome]|uniref:RNA polymerase-binding transcription factor DksA n=1 Tax=mine drainage metagenome TaxID=410659 RepID=A0A1J5QLD2_9ZZZZ
MQWTPNLARRILEFTCTHEIAFERSPLTILIRQALRHLDDIEAARIRVTSGQDRLCETCGQPIAPARLKARPVARTCIECAARRGGRGHEWPPTSSGSSGIR